MYKINLLLPIFLLIGCTNHTEKGSQFFESGQITEALYHFEKDLSIEPNNPMRLYNVARCYEEMAEYNKAINLYDRSISKLPDFKEAYLGRGRSNYKKKAYNLALMDFASVTTMDKMYAEAYYLAGLCYLKDSIYDEAVITLNKAIKLKPDYHLARYNKAVANASMSNVLFALRDLTYLINEEVLLDKSYFNRAFLYENMGNYAAALHDYDKAVKLGYINERIIERRGLCYLSLDRPKDACQEFEHLKGYNKEIAESYLQKYCNNLTL